MQHIQAQFQKPSGRLRAPDTDAETCLAWVLSTACGGLVLSLVLSHWTVSAKAADERVLLTGAATSNITPPLGSEVISGFHPFPATHIHDELHARHSKKSMQTA